MSLPSAIVVSDDAIEVADCRSLPKRLQYLRFTSVNPLAQALRDYLVYGPSLMPLAVAHAVALEARQHSASTSIAGFRYTLQESLYTLRAARPQFRPLIFCVEQLSSVVRYLIENNFDVEQSCRTLSRVAAFVERLLIEEETAIAGIIKEMIPDNSRLMVLGACGRLTSAGVGTVTGAITAARDEGKKVRVTIPQSYPLLSGSRVLSWELAQEKIDYELVIDELVPTLMLTEKFDGVLCPVNRLCRNGDISTTSGATAVAFACKAAGIPFYAVTLNLTADLSSGSLKDCPLEEFEHVQDSTGCRMRAAINNVVPAELITGYITRYGLFAPRVNGTAEQLVPILAGRIEHPIQDYIHSSECLEEKM